MVEAEYNVRVGIVVAGRQATSLDVHRRAEGEGVSQLVLGFGPVLIYLVSGRSLLQYFDTLQDATQAVMKLFPSGYTSPEGEHAARAPFPVITSVTSRWTDTTTMVARGGPHSRSGRRSCGCRSGR